MSGYPLCRRYPPQHIVILAIFKRLAVNDLDDTGSGEADQAALFEFAKRSAHGFNRDRQIVRNVISRDWQRDAVAAAVRQTIGHCKEKGRYFLLGGDAAQNHYVFLQARQPVEDDLSELARQLWVGVGLALNMLARITRYDCAERCRLDRVVVFGAGREPEEVPREQQVDDLAPSVRFDDAAQGRAGKHAVPSVRSVALAADFLPPMIASDHHNGIETLQRRSGRHSATSAGKRVR